VSPLIVTDSLAVPTGEGPRLEVVGIAPLLAEAIDRLHRRASLSDLLVHQ
jgi:phosphoribosylpyrophosphate synthetase